jgi:alpha-beta hydrolase superfamily lysophospholipase
MHRRHFITVSGAALVAGCAGQMRAAGLVTTPAGPIDGVFRMPDGGRLPYRAWLPADQRLASLAALPGSVAAGTDPWAVVLALHGFNDSRDAWEVPAPSFTAAGVAVFAPDQRGFGDTAERGGWAGTQTMVNDAAEMARQLRTRYPRARLFLMGESMGGAVLMRLATEPAAPPVDGYILVAPAVWGRAEMNLLLRATLWAAANVAPGIALGHGPIRVTASDNRAALIRLSTDPLTIRRTRIESLKGLVDLMDAALAAAPHFHAHSLFLYGGRDELVPQRATAATWHGLQDASGPATQIAFYPQAYHLLLRDRDRAVAINDILFWMHGSPASLPSGADTAARLWLAAQR